MVSPPTLSWAVVGASEVAGRQMIPAMRACGHAVAGVVSRSPEHGKRFAGVHGIPWSSVDLPAVLDREDIDAVYVSSHSDMHFSQSMSAVSAGKHVLCEKPMALSTADARIVIDAARTARVVYAVNHHLPGAATHRAIRRVIADGVIGEPLGVAVSHATFLPRRLWGWRLRGPDSGVVLDMTPHDASVINAALPSPADRVAAIGVQQGPWVTDAPDAVMFSATYGSVTVQVHNAYTIRDRPSRFEVYGSEGSIMAENVMFPDPTGVVTLRTPSGVHVVDCGQRRNVYEVVVDAFGRAVGGVGTPTVSGQAAANALSVSLAVRDSIAQRRTVRITEWFEEDDV